MGPLKSNHIFDKTLKQTCSVYKSNGGKIKSYLAYCKLTSISSSYSCNLIFIRLNLRKILEVLIFLVYSNFYIWDF